MAAEKRLPPGRRLKREDFGRVKSKHIRAAVHALSSGFTDHPFAKSTNFDVILDAGTRLAPKAVFGVAAKKALGINVQPKHFRGGEGTPCFRIIRAANFQIVPKSWSDTIPQDPADEWAEGNPKRQTHLSYERNRSAVRAKKKAFREKHGQLNCEKCGLVPLERYGDESGDACIEVHHKIPLSKLGTARNTKLEDLMCVCANCHRVLHHQMRLETQAEV